MNAQGIDLSSYASVKGHSTDIYEQTKWQNMPQGGTPWTPNRVQTFLNWINTGFPYAPSDSPGGRRAWPRIRARAIARTSTASARRRSSC
jgi:hypothetical protein